MADARSDDQPEWAVAVLLVDESGSAGLALACARRASVSALVPEMLLETITGSGDVKRIVGGGDAEGVLGDSAQGVLPLAKATFAPRGWGVCERECAGSGAYASQRVAGDWLGAGLPVGVGNRPERSGAMGVRRAGGPG
jgi:hypothetical protein